VAEHWLVCVVCPACKLVGLHDALTEVMVGVVEGLPVPPPPHPAAHNIPSKHREMIALQFIRPPVLNGHHSLVLLQLGLDLSMKHFTFTQRTWTDKTKV
jgi:hypothetical protein